MSIITTTLVVRGTSLVVRTAASNIALTISDVANTIAYHAHHIYHWLTKVAPVVVKYKLIQIGLDGVNGLPGVSQGIKQRVKKWIKQFAGL